MNSCSKQRIVIVGGGMVGISLALMLSKTLASSIQQGDISIVLVEQFPLNNKASMGQPSFDDRSTALSSGTSTILCGIDCWSELKAAASPIKRIHISDKGHFNGAQLQASDYQLDALGYVLENKRLGSVLMAQLQQEKINCIAPAQVTRCVARKAGYQLTVSLAEADSLDLHADLLVLADGADSPLRNQLGIDTEMIDYQQSALIANVALDSSHDGIAYERFTDEGPIALLPLTSSQSLSSQEQHRAALVWTIPQNQLDHIASLDSDQLLNHLQKRLGFRAGKINTIGQKQLYPLQLVKAKEQIRSHLVVMGNAAHFLHPVAGQGFNLAIRDCWSLARHVAAAAEKGMPIGTYTSLKNYIEQQHIDQAFTIGITDSLVTLFSSAHLSKSVVRQLGLLGLNTMPKFKKIFAGQMMGAAL